jgi:hypothetical protein
MTHQSSGVGKKAAALSINPNKIRIAKITSSLLTIRLSPTPKITSCETAKYRCAASMNALTLQGLE